MVDGDRRMFDISNYFFFLEMFVASLVVSMPFYRRKKFHIRLLLSIVGIVILSTFVPNGTIKFCVVTAAVCVMLYLCWQISWKKALYNTVCAYALQHLTYCVVPIYICVKNIFFHIEVNPEDMKPGFGIESWMLHIVVYAVCYFLFFRKKRKTDVDVSTGQVIIFAIAVFIVVLVLNSFLQRYMVTEEYGLFLVCYAYDMLCCIIIICLDDGIYRGAVAKSHLDMIQYLWKKRQNQYVIAENNINTINTKCHELKQQITKIQESGISQHLSEDLEDLKNSIGIYDAVVKTGNEVLDVVLTEKSLYCQSEKVVLACIVDGQSMDFIDSMDIYFIFETLLDDAVEKVCHIQDVQKRQIAISIWAQCGLLMIQIENYCQEKADEDHEEQKEYDLKSIEYTIKKYKGTMTGHTEGALFVRRISIPIPD